MEITDERFSGKKRFEELVPGDVFEFENEFFMRIYEFGDTPNRFNAVNIENGSVEDFLLGVYVTPLVTQLRIIRND